MGWNNYGGTASAGAKQAYVMEGQVPLYTFTDQPTRVRFLTEDVSVESVMSDKGLLREQAEDLLYTKIVMDRWIMPVSRWEHTIKEIPGKRFFSTVVCMGRSTCSLCAENEKAKANGIGENKLLPYPVRKRFFVPAWFYDLNRVLFVRGSEEFYNDVAAYVNKHGSACDFDIYRQGKGLNTKYKVVFVDKAIQPLGELDVPAPKDLNFGLDRDEWTRRVEGRPGQSDVVKSAVPDWVEVHSANVAEPAAEFAIPFGSHKGMTLKQLYDMGESQYILFLAKSAAGLVQEKAQAFVALMDIKV